MVYNISPGKQMADYKRYGMARQPHLRRQRGLGAG